MTLGRTLTRLASGVRLWSGKWLRTSLTDIREYRRCCEQAVADPANFKLFRRHPVYCSVVEGLDREIGAEAARIALDRHPDYRGLLERFRLNDSVGSPITYHYEAIGEFAPATLRYVKVLSDIEHLFGDLTGKHVVEIGGGFGGQCRVINCRFDLASYTIFDLPEAGALAKKYLAHFDIEVSVNPPADRIPVPDLLLSNYALSEVRRSDQDAYRESVVADARCGYMIWNELASRKLSRKRLAKNHQPYSAEEFCSMIAGGQIASTPPLLLTDDLKRANRLIYWR
jgi:hypothetical protein